MLRDLGAVQALALGSILAVASLMKATELARRASGDRTVLAEWLGEANARKASRLVVAIELCLAAALLGGFGIALASLTTCALFLAAAALLAVMKRRSPKAACGCFGSARRSAGSNRTVARALLLSILALGPVRGGGKAWFDAIQNPGAGAGLLVAIVVIVSRITGIPHMRSRGFPTPGAGWWAYRRPWDRG
jgi:hypothetical protein